MVLHHSIVGGFGLGRRDVADGLQQPTIVVPVDPLERGVLDGIKRSPRSFAPDHLSFVEAVDRFGERVVIAIANASHGRLKTSFGEALGVLDGHVLRSAVRVTDESAARDRPAIMQRLFECIENEAGVSRARDTPTDDLSGVDVDDEGDVDEA